MPNIISIAVIPGAVGPGPGSTICWEMGQLQKLALRSATISILLVEVQALAERNAISIHGHQYLPDTGKGCLYFLSASLRPSLPLVEYLKWEGRFTRLAKENQAEAERLLDIAQEAIKQRWSQYEELATLNAADFHPDARREQES